ncbi:hypothetical protein M0804_004816 [Polistes exclamans]|nr:hypothetical protein M0804_004816 [Polistes exclamans]
MGCGSAGVVVMVMVVVVDGVGRTNRGKLLADGQVEFYIIREIWSPLTQKPVRLAHTGKSVAFYIPFLGHVAEDSIVLFVLRAIIRLLEMDGDTGSTLTDNCAQFMTRRLGRPAPNANYTCCHQGIPKTTIYVTANDKNVYRVRSVNRD